MGQILDDIRVRSAEAQNYIRAAEDMCRVPVRLLPTVTQGLKGYRVQVKDVILVDGIPLEDAEFVQRMQKSMFESWADVLIRKYETNERLNLSGIPRPKAVDGEQQALELAESVDENE